MGNGLGAVEVASTLRVRSFRKTLGESIRQVDGMTSSTILLNKNSLFCRRIDV